MGKATKKYRRKPKQNMIEINTALLVQERDSRHYGYELAGLPPRSNTIHYQARLYCSTFFIRLLFPYIHSKQQPPLDHF